MTTVMISVDGRSHQVEEGQDLLKALLGLGYDLPYFCWHPAMGSVGACRQCAVKQFEDEDDDQGKIVMACMTPVADGMLVSVDDPEARRFRAQVIEWLMVHHPHDCPVCDEGGECHLQDVTVMTGHARRRYRFRKRTHRNQDLGPLIHHEMNRCIQCYRCVRFYRDYAGGTDLAVLGCHHNVYFGRWRDGTLESAFAGNLVEVCPTGVFTDKTLKKHYTRKWDLTAAPSICPHCGLGCNITVGERYGTLRRVLNRYNGEVNGYFLCDRGRFGYEHADGKGRLRVPRVMVEEDQKNATAKDAIVKAAALLGACDRIIGVGSPRASLESNFALRTLVGPESFVAGLAPGEAEIVTAGLAALRSGPAPAPSLRQVEQSDAALVLGEDVYNTAPRLALTLRQTARQEPIRRHLKAHSFPSWNDAAVREVVQDEHGPVFIATPDATWLDQMATAALRAAPDDIARYAYAVAAELGDEAARVADLSPEVADLAGRTAAALAEAQRPVVVSGPGCGSREVVEAAARVARALRQKGRPASLLLTSPEANTLGLALLGGLDMEDALLTASVESGKGPETIGAIILENDLFRRLPEREAEALLERFSEIVALDHLSTPTVRRAQVALPTPTFGGSSGTFVSAEGRAQRSFRALPGEEEVREGWRWLRALAERLERPGLERWQRLDDVVRAAAAAVPELAGIAGAAPGADFRLVGGRVPRQSFRYSGRKAMYSNITIHDPQPPPPDPDSPLAFSMEGAKGLPPASLLPFAWAPRWNSVQAWNKLQDEIGGAVRGGDGGVRLIEPAPALPEGEKGPDTSPPNSPSEPPPQEGNGIPEPFEPLKGQLLLVARHHVFGSEELSSLAPAIAELAPAPQVALNPDDARELDIEEGELIELELATGWSVELPVRLAPDLVRGVAAVPVGLRGVPFIELPAWATPRHRRGEGGDG